MLIRLGAPPNHNADCCVFDALYGQAHVRRRKRIFVLTQASITCESWLGHVFPARCLFKRPNSEKAVCVVIFISDRAWQCGVGGQLRARPNYSKIKITRITDVSRRAGLVGTSSIIRESQQSPVLPRALLAGSPTPRPPSSSFLFFVCIIFCLRQFFFAFDWVFPGAIAPWRVGVFYTKVFLWNSLVFLYFLEKASKPLDGVCDCLF